MVRKGIPRVATFYGAQNNVKECGISVRQGFPSLESAVKSWFEKNPNIEIVSINVAGMSKFSDHIAYVVTYIPLPEDGRTTDDLGGISFGERDENGA